MKKVIIIGAGPAGLTAAYELLKEKKYEVIILEESDNIGGIAKTVDYKGNKMDIGGHRFFSKSEKIMNYWKSLMPIQGKQSFDDIAFNRRKTLNGTVDPEKVDNVWLVRNRISRIYCFHKFFDYPISLKLQTLKNLGFVRTIKSGASYLKSLVSKRDEKSLEDFYINRFGKYLYNTFFENYTEKLWKRHPYEISSDWGAQRVKGLSIKEVLKDSIIKKFSKEQGRNVETSLITKYLYPKYGPGQLWELMAMEIKKMGGVIKKKCRVDKIIINGKKIESVEFIFLKKRKKIDGDIFISTMPLKDLVLSFNNVKVPKKILSIANGLPYIDFQTLGLLVKKMKLKNNTKIKTFNNIVPDCWIYIQDPNVKMLRFQIFNNWSPYMVSNIKKNIWIGLEYTCLENDKYWNMTDDEFANFSINELVSLNVIDKDDVIDYHREKIKKAYPAYFDTYENIEELKLYLNKFDNLYCIGRNGQHRYNNMDHSMLTAIEAVNSINNNKNKDSIWDVNIDKSYHELRNMQEKE